VARAHVTAISWRKSPGERVQLQLPRRKSVPEIASDVEADRADDRVQNLLAYPIVNHRVAPLVMLYEPDLYLYIDGGTSRARGRAAPGRRVARRRRAFIARAYHASARFIVGDK